MRRFSLRRLFLTALCASGGTLLWAGDSAPSKTIAERLFDIANGGKSEFHQAARQGGTPSESGWQMNANVDQGGNYIAAKGRHPAIHRDGNQVKAYDTETHLTMKAGKARGKHRGRFHGKNFNATPFQRASSKERAAYKADFQMAYELGATLKYEAQMENGNPTGKFRINGQVIDVVQNVINGLGLVNADAADRKVYDAKLADLEARLRAAFTATPNLANPNLIKLRMSHLKDLGLPDSDRIHTGVYPTDSSGKQLSGPVFVTFSPWRN